jgi:tetratricopeptide (TPR) repeat protein
MRKLGFVLLAVGFFSGAGAPLAQAKAKWVALRSPNLTVFSDAGEEAARKVALRLEAISDVFALLGLPAGATRPVRVFVVRDEAGLRELYPSLRQRKYTVGGFFAAGGASHTIVIRYDPDHAPYTTVHEYVHLLGRQTLRRLPVWLDEGLAQFYATIEIEKSSILIGRVQGPHMWTVKANPALPLERFFEIDRHSPEFGKSHGVTLFYSQTALFTHFLFLGKNGVRRAQIGEYASLVDDGVPEPEARLKAFGDPKVLEREFRTYLSQSGFPAIEIQAKRDETSLRPVPLTDAQALAFRAEFLAQYWPAEARVLLAEARKVDPAFGLGHRVEGFLLSREGKAAEAAEALEKAIAETPTDFLAHYWLGMARPKKDEGPESRARREKALRRVIELQPAYALAHAGLAELLSETGCAEAAVTAAKRAVELEPREISHGLGLLAAYRACDRKADADALEARLLEASSSDPADLQSMAAYYRKTGRSSDVEDRLRKALLAQPASWGALSSMATFLEDGGREEEMQALLRAALKTRPDDPHLLTWLARTYAERNVHVEEAYELADKAVKKSQNDAVAFDTRGWAHFRLRRFKEAERDLRRSLELTKSAAVIDRLGDVLAAMGRREEALTQWREALQTPGTDETLQAALAAKLSEAERRKPAADAEKPAS